MEYPMKVACVGDSITYGETLSDVARESYPAQLGRMLGEGFSVHNCGRSGAGLWHSGFFPYTTTAEFSHAVSLGAGVIIACLGTNDLIYPMSESFGKEFVEDYCSLMDALRRNSPYPARVYIAQIPPVPALFKETADSPVHRLNALIETVALRCGATLVDFHQPFEDCPALLSDGVHPNREGALLLAGKAFEVLVKGY